MDLREMDIEEAAAVARGAVDQFAIGGSKNDRRKNSQKIGKVVVDGGVVENFTLYAVVGL